MRIAAAIFLGVVCGSADAGGIYKWVDKAGNVHFGDESEAAAEPTSEVTVKTAPVDAEAVGRLKRQNEYVDARTEERAAAKTKAAEDQKKKEQLAADCAKLKDHLVFIQKHPRVYREGENGAKAYVSPAERDAEMASTQAQLDQHCNK